MLRRIFVGLLLAFFALGALAREGQPVAADHLGAVGIGVRDLAASSTFYQEVLGLQLLRKYELGVINEIVLGYPDGSTAVVLMNWPNDNSRHYKGTDVKLVFYVADPKAIIDRIRQHGGAIEREATPLDLLNGALVGLGRDPDNYMLEIISRDAVPGAANSKP